VSEMCNFEFSVIDSEKDLLYDFLLESSSEENNPLPYKITIEKSEKNTFDKLLKIILSYLIIRFILSFISWISIISRDQTLGWKIKWFFLTLITGIFGIIIYYFFANKKKITNKTSEESKKNSGTIEVPKYEEPSNQEINVPKFK
ncbi:MAG: hypothetical protein KKF89_00250, partial [Nanoarchaeota archaeon]|nr:hypothetical protein [Nanoarchaeota archaeon]